MRHEPGYRVVVAIHASRRRIACVVRRRIHMVWLRTALFTFLVPGTVLGLVPFVLIATNWGPRFNVGAAHLVGFMLLMAGVAIIVWCFIDFVRQGHGTPAPYDPPRRLVVAGLYKCTRNPQYFGRRLCRFERGRPVWQGASVRLRGLSSRWLSFVRTVL